MIQVQLKLNVKLLKYTNILILKKHPREKSPTNGIMSFITGKYSPQMPLAGMIGFIKEGEINSKIDRIKKKLQKHKDIITYQNLSEYLIKKDFEYSYESKHKRMNKLKDISIYHLFFDFV